MTPKEAIEILMSDEKLAEIEYYGGFEGQKKVAKLYSEAIDMAIEALEKQIPKKPTKLTYKLLIDAGWIYACPNCKMACGENKYHLEATSDEMYCPSCGQAIDWSEEE